MHRPQPRTTPGRTSIGARRARRVSTALVLLALVVAGASACNGKEETRTLGPITLALSETTPVAQVPAAGNAGAGAAGAGLFETQTAVVLPLIDRPADGAAASKPYPRAPWFGPGDLQMQLTYTISNLGDQSLQIELTIDPWNEFIRYAPTVTVDEEGNVNADPSPNDRRLLIAPHARISGTISYDDFYRMALDLAVIMNGVPNPFHAIEPHTRIIDDPQTRSFVPDAIDGLTGFDVSLRSTVKAKLAFEATLELIDHGGYLVPEGATSNARPPGTIYNPKLRTGP